MCGMGVSESGSGGFGQVGAVREPPAWVCR